MFCPKCGSEHPDDSQFCRKCGQGLASPTSSGVSVGAGAAVAPARIQEVNPQEPPKPSSRWKRIPLFLLVLVIVLLVSYSLHNSASRESASHDSASHTQQPAKQQHFITVNNPNLHVNALAFNYFKLDVPSGATNARLRGNFTASGGFTNDIEVYVLSTDDFVNWQNRHAAKSFYSSGTVTVGTLDVNLPADAGTYYLVFNNRFSLLTLRNVNVDAALTYVQ